MRRQRCGVSARARWDCGCKLESSQSLGRAGVAERRDAVRCGGGGGVVATASRLLGMLVVCEDASGAFSRARVAASHTGVRQSRAAVQCSAAVERFAVQGESDAGDQGGRSKFARSLLPFHIQASLQA